MKEIMHAKSRLVEFNINLYTFALRLNHVNCYKYLQVILYYRWKGALCVTLFNNLKKPFKKM